MITERTIQQEWYVSPTGNDNYAGHHDQPFQTIGRAISEMRKYAATMKGDIRIWLLGGIYRQTEPLLFTPEEAAALSHEIVFAAYPGERAIVSGGAEISGWEPVRDQDGRRLFKASAAGMPYSRHLYVNGKAARRPRSAEIKATAWNVAKDDTYVFHNHVETVKTYQGELKVHEGYRSSNVEMLGWRNPQDIEAVFDVAWTHSICPVDAIVPEGGDGAVITMKMPCFRDCQIKAGVQVGVPSYFENVFELMCHPGEWYYDRTEASIVYYAHEGENPNEMSFVIPLAERLVDIRGELGRLVRGIAFEGIEFCHTTFMQPLESGHPEVQANLLKDSGDDLNAHSAYIKVPSAIVLHAAEDISFRNCRFHRLGSGAVDIEFGSRNNIFIGNEFVQLGGSGIQVGGFSFDDAHPSDQRELVLDNQIENNYFHRIGEDFKGSVAVTVGYAEGTVITHNEICDIAYTGISLGWGWGYCDPGITRLSNFPPDYYPVFDEPTVLRRSRVEYNHIHHVLQKLHDGGAIYTLSAQPGTTIKGNYIHHNGNKAGVTSIEDVVRHTWGRYEEYNHYAQVHGFPGGIYMDEATAEIEISGNVIHDVVVPIYYHEGVIGTFKTISVYGNVTHLKPDQPGFPAERAAKAGLEDPYRHLLLC